MGECVSVSIERRMKWQFRTNEAPEKMKGIAGSNYFWAPEINSIRMGERRILDHSVPVAENIKDEFDSAGDA